MQQPTLFDDQQLLLLPEDLMEYTPGFLEQNWADVLLESLLEQVPWQGRKVMMYDKEVQTPRLSAWYGNKSGNSENRRIAHPWLPELLALHQLIESHTGIRFDGVLLNYYRDGRDSVAWHSDKDTLPGIKTEIASISIGAERNFEFRSKVNHRKCYSLKLQHGSLLLMKGDLQRFWEHRIPKSALPMKARINLTFRKTRHL